MPSYNFADKLIMRYFESDFKISTTRGSFVDGCRRHTEANVDDMTADLSVRTAMMTG